VFRRSWCVAFLSRHTPRPGAPGREGLAVVTEPGETLANPGDAVVISGERQSMNVTVAAMVPATGERAHHLVHETLPLEPAHAGDDRQPGVEVEGEVVLARFDDQSLVPHGATIGVLPAAT